MHAGAIGCNNNNPGESATLGETGTTTDGTTGDTETEPTTGQPEPCANPEFASTIGPGTMVQCAGEVVNSVFSFSVCQFDCDNPDSIDITPVAFPEDEQVGACCVGTATQQDYEEACLSDCAHATCLEAIQRFQDEIDKINGNVGGNAASNCPTQGCRDRVVASFAHFRDFIASHFTDCVKSIQMDVTFNMGDGPCGTFIGCLHNGSLDLNCNVTAVNTDVVLEPVCDDALHQPPDTPREQGDIIGGQIQVYGLLGNTVTPMTGAYVRSARPLCVGSPCTLVLEDIDIVADDFQVGLTKVKNLKAELATLAVGELVGDSAVFAPGSITVHVTADIKQGLGPWTAFEGYADNDEPAYVDTTDSVFTLDNAVFHEGTMTFVASIDPSPCEPM